MGKSWITNPMSQRFKQLHLNTNYLNRLDSTAVSDLAKIQEIRFPTRQTFFLLFEYYYWKIIYNYARI